MNRFPCAQVTEMKPADLPPWLGENIDVLGEERGMDLSPVESEISVGDFEADIHADDSGGCTVVIENQSGKSGKHTLFQS